MMLHRVAATCALLVCSSASFAQSLSPGEGRDIPGYFLPVPDDISPEIRPLAQLSLLTEKVE